MRKPRSTTFQRLTSAAPAKPRADEFKDFGLGAKLASGTQRFLNRDGSFNVRRTGQPFSLFISPYHYALTISWTRFNALVALGYLVANILFAAGYLLCGAEAFEGMRNASVWIRIEDCFFFSVQTLATIGYGRISPLSTTANVLVTIEALAGLLGFALATGLLFARFSRPQAKILFSRNAVIAPYRGGSALMFRIINGRTNQLIDVEAAVSLSRFEMVNGVRARKFHSLELERRSVGFFPLHWVIVHPVSDSSPLFGVTKEEFDASEAEILILLKGTDDTFAQTVHTRSSFRHHEVVWGAKFGSMYVDSADGVVTVDLSRLHDVEPA